MKTFLVPLLGIAVLMLCQASIKADSLSLATQGNPKSYSVPSNVVATVTHANCNNPSYYINVSVQGVTMTYSAVNGVISNLPSITGPATITLYPGNASAVAVCTMETKSAVSPYSAVPSAAVVIPSDGTGSVAVSLEMSADMINWVGCQPGMYSNTQSNRFFRVRATR